MVISKKRNVVVDTKKSKANSMNAIGKQISNDIELLTKEFTVVKTNVSSELAKHNELIKKRELIIEIVALEEGKLEKIKDKAKLIPYKTVTEVNAVIKDTKLLGKKKLEAENDLASVISKISDEKENLKKEKSLVSDQSAKRKESFAITLENSKKLDSINSSIEKANKSLTSANNDVDDAKSRELKVESQILNKNLKLQSATEKINQAKEKNISLGKEKDSKTRELESITGVIESKRAQGENLDAANKELTKEAAGITQSINEKKKLDSELISIGEQIDLANKSLNDVETKISEGKSELGNIKQRIGTELNLLEANKQEVLRLIMVNKKHLKSQEIAKLIKEIESGIQ